MSLWSKIRSWGRDVDPAYSKGKLGHAIGSGGREFFREAFATSAIGLTGGTILLARPSLAAPAERGYMLGASFGLSRNPLAAARQLEANVTGSVTTVPTGTGAFQQGGKDAELDLGAIFKNPIVLVVLAILAILILAPSRSKG